MHLLWYLYQKPVRGDAHIVGILFKSKKTIFLNLIGLLHTRRSTPNLVYAPGDRIAMSRGGSTSGGSTHGLVLNSENSRASKQLLKRARL